MPSSPSWYGRYLLPHLLDLACGLSPITRQRRKVIPQATGQVLEIGIGTGLNFAFYDRSKVEKLVGVDPAAEMHTLARKRSQRLGVPVELLQLSAEQLPAASGSFDTVVCTYSLCSIANPYEALCEMRRVLRPGGKLLFAEHGLAPDQPVARWQVRLEPYWGLIAGGCHLTRDVPRLLVEAGFSASIEAGYVAWPKALAYNYVGTAVAVV
jgi:SAM-dependent methyltransferase